MGNIKTIFDVEDTVLDDLRADPNDVILVQKKVKEMLSESALRQAGLRNEITALGVRALPGVISATYVLTKQLNNVKNRSMVAKLVAELAGENPAAIRLILTAGVTENPFYESRAVTIEALGQLDAASAVMQAQSALAQAAQRADAIDDQKTARQIYGILLRHRLQIEHAVAACYKRLSSGKNAEEALQLASAILTAKSDEIEKLLVDLLSKIKYNERNKQESKKVQLEVKNSLRLPSHHSLLPAIHAANTLLSRSGNKRSKPVEGFFQGAIAHIIVSEPSLINDGFNAVLAEGMQMSLVRYWWQAVSEAVKMGCRTAEDSFVTTIREIPDPSDQVYGVLQLIFLDKEGKSENSTWAKTLLSTYKGEMPSLVADANDLFERIKSGTQPQSPEGIREKSGGPSTLRKNPRQ
jgi:hypothetical protein